MQTKTSKKVIFLLIFLIAASLFFRFYNIGRVIPLTWDQVRDAWVMKDLLVDGKFPLLGPRTGIGHFHLGPAYYYLLAPLYFLTNLDPIAAGWFAVLATLLTMISLFWVGRAVFGIGVALLAVFICAFSGYLISMDRVPWNVSLVMMASVWIFYSLFKINEGQNRWFIPLGLLAGFFFHLHFTAVFIPPIIILSLLLVKNKKRIIPWALTAILLFLVFFIPSVVQDLRSSLGDYLKLKEFIGDYYHGFHFRFMLYRLPEVFLVFQSVLFLEILRVIKYILPLIFLAKFILFPENKTDRFVGTVFFFFFLVTLVGFTVYSGPLSDYYFLLTMPFAIYMIAYLMVFIFRLKIKIINITLVTACLFWAYKNVQPSFNNYSQASIDYQKQEVLKQIKLGKIIDFQEGNPASYLYYFYTRKK